MASDKISSQISFNLKKKKKNLSTHEAEKSTKPKTQLHSPFLSFAYPFSLLLYPNSAWVSWMIAAPDSSVLLLQKEAFSLPTTIYQPQGRP